MFIFLHSCTNEDVIIDSNNPNQKDQSVITCVSQSSTEIGDKLIEGLEYELNMLNMSSETRSYSQLNHILTEFDITNQEVVTSTEKDGKVFMVRSKTNPNNILAFYEDENGIILNVKKISISTTNDDVVAKVNKLDNTDYLTVGGNINNETFSVLSYNPDIFGNLSVETRSKSVGCSGSIMAASLPWSIGFGMLHPLAGGAVSLVFWAMSEIMC